MDRCGQFAANVPSAAQALRDRQVSFEPQLVPERQTRWAGFDDKILSLYARGMTVREIQGHLQEMYGA